MHPRCGSEIKISSARNYLMQVQSRQQHNQHCHSPMPGECELCRPFVQKKLFTLPGESRPIHFHCHVTDMCESALRNIPANCALWDKMQMQVDKTTKKVHKLLANLFVCKLYLPLIEVSYVASEIMLICGNNTVQSQSTFTQRFNNCDSRSGDIKLHCTHIRAFTQ